jgi:hypothetical protein
LCICSYICFMQGHTIAQAVSRWLPTAAARVRARVWSCGICGGQNGAGAGVLRVLRFPLPIFIPPVAPQSPSFIIWGLYNRPEVAAVPSGLSPTPLLIIKKIICFMHHSLIWVFCVSASIEQIGFFPSFGGGDWEIWHFTFDLLEGMPLFPWSYYLCSFTECSAVEETRQQHKTDGMFLCDYCALPR